MDPTKSRRLRVLAELKSAITAKFQSPDFNHLSSSVLSSLSTDFSKLSFKISRDLQTDNSSALLRHLEKVSPLCRRLYFSMKKSTANDIAALIIRFFTEFGYPIDLTAAFYDDDVALQYGIESENGQEIVARTCVRLRPLSVVRLDINVASVDIEKT
jgi:hypothetical protein